MKCFPRRLARELRSARKGLRLTQEQVAERAGISLRWYQMLESGHCEPGGRVLLRLVFLLGLDISGFRDAVGPDPRRSEPG